MAERGRGQRSGPGRLLHLHRSGFHQVDGGAMDQDQQRRILLGRHGTHLTLRNNYVLNTRFAVNLCAPDSVCEGNVITNFSGDGIRITRDGITVQYNTIKNSFVGPDQAMTTTTT